MNVPVELRVEHVADQLDLAALGRLDDGTDQSQAVAVGISVVFQDGKQRPQGEYEIVSGTRVEPQLEESVALAARWIHALVHGDMERLEELSDPAIVYRIVQEHQGEIFLDSEPGAGTTVTIELPVRSEPISMSA